MNEGDVVESCVALMGRMDGDIRDGNEARRWGGGNVHGRNRRTGREVKLIEQSAAVCRDVENLDTVGGDDEGCRVDKDGGASKCHNVGGLRNVDV